MSIHESTLLPLIVFLPLLGAFINGVFGRRFPKGLVTAIGTTTVGVSFALTIYAWLALRAHIGAGEADPAIRSFLWPWIDSGSLRVNFAFSMDRLSAVMALVVTGVGFLIHIFSVGYMHADEAYHRYFSYINLFMFSMLVLVLGDNMVLMFMGWEGVGLCSYLLIGFWFTDDQKAQAGQKAFVVNRVGDFGFLLGMFLLIFYMDGTTDFGLLKTAFSEPLAAVGGTPLRDPVTITLICLLLFVGATGKSAQIPLYVWLPDAMAGPTPVSALIHAATMVTAGVYMIARLHFVYVLSPVAMATVAVVGALTAIVAASIGLLQRDIKKVLAYSTVSQLGYMFLAVGSGAFAAGVFHLMTHAFFKALLFLGSGAVIHAMHHEQDIFKMGNLRKILPVTHWTFLIGTMAIAGVPFLAGFWSKEAILHGAAGLQYTAEASLLDPFGLGAGSPIPPWLYQTLAAVGLLAAAFTAFYMFRLYFLTFWGEYRGDQRAWDHPHRPGWSMRIPLIVLAVMSVAGGYIPIEQWLAPTLEKAGHFYVTHHTTLGDLLLYLSLAVAGTGIALAWFLYQGPGRGAPARLKAGLQPVYNLVYNKYFVDEMYHVLIVRPLQVIAQVSFKVVDRLIIDILFVNGSAQIVALTGRLVRFFQNGDVQRYAAAIVVGVAVLFYFIR
ncbi:MAG: NADH dehydrogenase subunit L [Myxococcales bacterium]